MKTKLLISYESTENVVSGEHVVSCRSRELSIVYVIEHLRSAQHSLNN